MSCNLKNQTETSLKQAEKKLDLPEGVPPLTTLYLYISGSCNLACRHCWIIPTHRTDGHEGQYVKTEHVQKVIRGAKPLGLGLVKLTGGEPMLHPQFREIVGLVNSEGVYMQIETNGTLLDHKMAKFLKQTRQLSFISISIDGATAESHDELRGVTGSFDSAVGGIRNLVEEGFRPQLICTLHKGNMSQMDKIIGMAEDLGCGSIKFNHVQKMGRGERYAEELGLGVSELINLYRSVENYFIPRSKISIHFDIPFAFYPIRKLLNDRLPRCNVRNILGMLAGGELSLCGIGVTIPELIYGQIGEKSVKEVWCYSPGLTRLRDQVPSKLEGICAQCFHRDICLASCVANNFHMTGRLNAPFQFCESADALRLFPESRKKNKITGSRKGSCRGSL